MSGEERVWRWVPPQSCSLNVYVCLRCDRYKDMTNEEKIREIEEKFAGA
jgi:hypothetical protein